MHAIHVSPHITRVGRRFAEGSGLVLLAAASVVALAVAAFVAFGSYLWNFS
jgi:hypothetical protein